VFRAVQLSGVGPWVRYEGMVGEGCAGGGGGVVPARSISTVEGTFNICALGYPGVGGFDALEESLKRGLALAQRAEGSSQTPGVVFFGAE